MWADTSIYVNSLLYCICPQMSGVVDLMDDGDDGYGFTGATAAPATAGAGVADDDPVGAAAATPAASGGAAVKHAGEMELETPFVEKYRPVFVSQRACDVGPARRPLAGLLAVALQLRDIVGNDETVKRFEMIAEEGK